MDICVVEYPESEERLLVLKDNVLKHSSLIEFGYECASYEYNEDVKYFGDSWVQEHTWDCRKKIYTPMQINEAQFVARKNSCIKLLGNVTKIDFNGIFVDAYLMHDCWNSWLMVSQIDNYFITFSWETSV